MTDEIMFEIGKRTKNNLTTRTTVHLSNGVDVEYLSSESPLDDRFYYCSFETKKLDDTPEARMRIIDCGGVIVEEIKGFWYVGRVAKHLWWNRNSDRMLDKVIEWSELSRKN